MAWKEVEAESVVIERPRKRVVVIGKDGGRTYLPIAQMVAVEMVSDFDRVSHVLLAYQMAPFMRLGYAIVKVGFDM